MKLPLYLTVFKTHNALKTCTRPRMAVYGLSPGQPKILRYLSKRDHWMQKELANACEISAATVSNLLSKMEEAGLITRSEAQDDRRAGSISITDAGRKAIEAWNEECFTIEARGLQGFSEEEKAAFADYLSRMYKNLSGKEIE